MPSLQERRAVTAAVNDLADKLLARFGNGTESRKVRLTIHEVEIVMLATIAKQWADGKAE